MLSRMQPPFEAPPQVRNGRLSEFWVHRTIIILADAASLTLLERFPTNRGRYYPRRLWSEPCCQGLSYQFGGLPLCLACWAVMLAVGYTLTRRIA